MPSPDNAAQIAEWNGELGRRWAESRAELERVVAPFGRAALERAALRGGEGVVDIGCGSGETTFEIARRVGARGRVLGVDVSRPLLAVALDRARRENCGHVEFREADAAQADLPPQTDVLFSRFGVMFFADPVAAFAHLRGALRAGGRLVFVCWRAPHDNPWAMVPLAAARQAVGIVPPPPEPNAPGPFAFVDGTRVRTILESAGLREVAVDRCDAAVTIGTTPRAAAESCLRVGPVARYVREHAPARAGEIVDAIAAALAPLAAADGRVELEGSAWLVSATK